MPSYRYTRDIRPEDVGPEQPREYTKKEKRANWWHYHWKWVAAILVVAALVFFFVYDMVSKDVPDASVGVLVPYGLPQPVLDDLAACLEGVWGDVNGDGKTYVEVQVFTIDAGGEEEAPPAEAESDAMPQMESANDAYAQMAGVVRLSAVYETGDVIIFLAEPGQAETYQEGYIMFGEADGAMPAGEASLDEVSVPLADLPGFAALGEESRALLGDYRVGLRPYAGTQLEDMDDGLARWQQADRLLKQLSAPA